MFVHFVFCVTKVLQLISHKKQPVDGVGVCLQSECFPMEFSNMCNHRFLLFYFADSGPYA